MTMTHIHLLLNHVPVIGIMVVLPVLAWGIWRKGAALSAKVSGTATRPEANVGGPRENAPTSCTV